MELCTLRPISNLPHFRLFTPSHARFQQFHSNSAVPQIHGLNFRLSGLRGYANLSLKSSFSDESSGGLGSYSKDGPDGVITFEDSRPVEREEYGAKFSNEAPKEDSPEENQVQPFELLENLDIKFDSDNTYSILLIGGGTLVALYLTTAIIGAIDSIPLVPKLMQVVGLSYTLWFTSRYLVFKENREELAAKIKDIKKQVLGSDDD